MEEAKVHLAEISTQKNQAGEKNKPKTEAAPVNEQLKSESKYENELLQKEKTTASKETTLTPLHDANHALCRDIARVKGVDLDDVDP